jgi:hypothetical protein
MQTNEVWIIVGLNLAPDGSVNFKTCDTVRYKCNRPSDGVAVTGPNNTVEGGDSRNLRYFCGPTGAYNIPTSAGIPNFPRCLPRRKNCFGSIIFYFLRSEKSTPRFFWHYEHFNSGKWRCYFTFT